LAVRPRVAVRGPEGDAIGAEPVDRVVEQPAPGIETLRVPQLGQGELQGRPECLRRQAVAGERVDVRRGAEHHHQFLPGPRIMPSWATVATCSPSRVKKRPPPSPRPPWALAASWAYSSQSSIGTGRWNHMAW